MGILPGAAAEASDGGIAMRNDTLFAHWQAFHMQCSLCLIIPCITNENIDEKCEKHCFMTVEALYCHLLKMHKTYLDHKIGEVGKTQKPKVMEEIIIPNLKAWLDQVMTEPGCGLWMLIQTKFRVAFRRCWRPQGHVEYTNDWLQQDALDLPKCMKLV